MKFTYELFDAEGREKRANGFSSHVWLDLQSRKPVRADAEVVRAFEAFLVGGSEAPRRIGSEAHRLRGA
jgi:acyl-CoA thioesterase FadM